MQRHQPASQPASEERRGGRASRIPFPAAAAAAAAGVPDARPGWLSPGSCPRESRSGRASLRWVRAAGALPATPSSGGGGGGGCSPDSYLTDAVGGQRADESESRGSGAPRPGASPASGVAPEPRHRLPEGAGASLSSPHGLASSSCRLGRGGVGGAAGFEVLPARRPSSPWRLTFFSRTPFPSDSSQDVSCRP